MGLQAELVAGIGRPEELISMSRLRNEQRRTGLAAAANQSHVV